ncbi:MAG: hypothetical protein FWD05_12910 [Oscillospiraceae bacterium]|nr:hypothetical protein [Oscillospiraceae bacterium]
MANELVRWIAEWIYVLMPLFRAAWVVTILIGVALLVVAFILGRNPERKKSPWITGGIGLAMFISSSTQLLFSFI